MLPKKFKVFYKFLSGTPLRILIVLHIFMYIWWLSTSCPSKLPINAWS